MNKLTPLQAVLAIISLESGLSILSRAGVKTPEGCGKCLYRDESMRDGGYCYMFREMPKPTCAQFKMKNRQ